MAPAVNEVKLTKPQRKFVREISDTMLKMLQSPVSMPYSSSDSSSVVILGKLPTSEKKSSGPELKSFVGDNHSSKKSIMSIGSFGEELYKLKTHLVARQQRREKGVSGVESFIGGEEGLLIHKDEIASQPPNIDPDLYEAMKEAMNLGIAIPSTAAVENVVAKSIKAKEVVSDKDVAICGIENARPAPLVLHGRDKDCELKSESNKQSSNRLSHGSTQNETSCSCQSVAEP